jgi:hypothetical protein
MSGDTNHLTALSVTNLKVKKLGCLVQIENIFLIQTWLSKTGTTGLRLSWLQLLILPTTTCYLKIIKQLEILKEEEKKSSVQFSRKDIRQTCYSFPLTLYLLTTKSTTFDRTQWFITVFTSAFRVWIMALCVTKIIKHGRELWDMRYSQWCCWQRKCPEIRCHVIRGVFSGILKDDCAFIFRV